MSLSQKAAICHSRMFCHLQNLVTGASHKPKIVRACHLQHSMSVLAGCHPRPRPTEQISSDPTRTCLTKFRNRSVAFVPEHVGSTGAKWSATVERFFVTRRLDVEVYGNAHQVFEVQICTICVGQLQNGPPKSSHQIKTKQSKSNQSKSRHSNRTASHHITSHHITSHHITSHHIT